MRAELREGGGGTGLAIEATSGPEDGRLRCQGSGKCRLPHGERVGAGDRESGLGAGCFSSPDSRTGKACHMMRYASHSRSTEINAVSLFKLIGKLLLRLIWSVYYEVCCIYCMKWPLWDILVIWKKYISRSLELGVCTSFRPQ